MKFIKITLSVTAVFLLSLLSNLAQTPIKNYEQQWKKVDDLINNKNLPKSALTEVKKIYALAKKEKQDAQIIKAVVYMIGLQQENREENELSGINEIEKEISVNKEPVVSILKSLLAELYRNYFQNNRWKLYSRTETAQFKKEDIATWSAGDFHKKISELFLQSVSNEKSLRLTKLSPFDAVIIKGNTRHLRPTLYDLLAHRALEYYKNDERDIAKPSYSFEIDQAYAFDPAAEFISGKFNTRDSSSLQHKALLLYQKLMAFHLKDIKPGALLDLDIERLQFVNDHSTHPDKINLYRAALNQIATKFRNDPGAAQAWYLLAQQHNQDADQYKPLGDITYRYSRLVAKEICENVLKQKDSSEGKMNCFNLLNEITKKDLQFSLEKVNIPGQPFRVLINYRNIDQLNLRLIPATEKLKEKLINYNDEKTWSELITASPVKSWLQNLPATNDYQQHTVEIKVSGLPIGEYILLASPDAFSKNSIIGARIFYVSNISYVNQGNDYFVLNRETGKPLIAAVVQTWNNVYDNKNHKYITEKGSLYKTDNNGFLKIAEKENNNRRENIRLEITWNDDRLFMDDWTYNYYYYNSGSDIDPTEKDRRVFFFTDRSIYRPGQTVFFKGIIIMPDNELKNKVLPDFSSKVYLKDVNYQRIDSLLLKTNEYGSYSGKFQVPQTSLNGMFTIEAEEGKGQVHFSVEEYKRPKFYVEYEKIKGSYKVGDKIKVTGLAKAYAGNNIDGAEVKYRVVREPRFIYPWLFSRWWQPPTESMEIAHGEIKTDEDGKFELEFVANPDKTLGKKFDPVFDYKIYADVTDINGETRSGQTEVSAGYKSLLLRVNFPASMPVDSLKFISVFTENMAGEFVEAKANLVITKLKEEKRLIRNRYWERPDQFVMTKEEYIANFPYDEYADESDYQSWEKGERIYGKEDSVKENGQWAIINKQFVPGFYVVEISTKDKYGEEVKDVRYLELTNEKSNQLAYPKYLWSESSNRQIEPGEKTAVKIGTSADNLFVVHEVDKTRNSRLTAHIYQFTSLNNEIKSIEFTATEDDRGGYGVNWFFIKHNRFYSLNKTIAVPWANKDLKIEYATFRDKTLPGSEEKWKIKISGYKKEKITAEMLASMYDASLDQFKMHSWYKPSIWPYYNSRIYWNSSQNFVNIISLQKWIPVPQLSYQPKSYDQLIPVGNNMMYQIRDRGVMENRPIAEENKVFERVDLLGQGAALKESIPIKISGKSSMTNDSVTGNTEQPKNQVDNSPVQIRKNFSETAFFFPELRTDSNSIIEFSFILPEALTKWKFQALAFTKDLAFGYSSKEIVTQKQLMVQPNAPRFLREGDKMEFSAKIVNLTDKELTGQVELQLFNAATNESVSGWFRNMFPNQYFTVAAGKSEAVMFPVEVPYLFDKALTWRIVAKAGDFSDGEEALMAVLTNRMLVTETLPLNMRSTGTKNFKFDKLVNSNSETLQNQSLTVEYTSNPAWYAVQALPYLMEYPYECAEQTWNRYYANALASKIANSSKRIKEIFETWKTKDTAALLSNLQKNQELKAVLLEETPWVLQAKNEELQKKNIALLFDLVRMSKELNSSYEKLKQMQNPNGGFIWFKGGPDNPYMTLYIITGIGHLKKLGVDIKKLSPILDAAIPYLDLQIKRNYDELKKYKPDLAKYIPGQYEIQYLYMRSFFPDRKIPAASQTAYNFFQSRSQKTWMKQSKYMQGMIALALDRAGDTKTPSAILKSLKETSINNEELGMYWKENSGGWYWYQAPIETQALMIEAFQEISKDIKTTEDLKTWLLKNKQTTNWKTTKATAEACYALLLQGSDWLSNETVVEIKLGNTTIKSTDNKQEAGTGYFKKTIDGPLVTPDMGNITVTQVSSKIPLLGGGEAWGAVYWQYFENLDKITTASTPLKLQKKLFVEKNTDRGPVLTPLKENEPVKIGNKIKVRIELRADRDMEYVHMKDMRASCMEPVNVISKYKWQGGLGYYETTKDASTNFFFDYLRKGTYVFEYTLFVTHAGNFSNGITSIQCMYAPEFSSHSEGIRINVD